VEAGYYEAAEHIDFSVTGEYMPIEDIQEFSGVDFIPFENNTRVLRSERASEDYLSRDIVLEIVENFLLKNEGKALDDFTSIGLYFGEWKLGEADWIVNIFGDTGLNIEDFHPLDPMITGVAGSLNELDPTNHQLFEFIIDANTGEFRDIVVVEPIAWSYSRAGQLNELNSDQTVNAK